LRLGSTARRWTVHRNPWTNRPGPKRAVCHPFCCSELGCTRPAAGPQRIL